MLKAFMQELVGYKLPYPETWSQKEMQAAEFVKVNSVFGKRYGAHPTQDVDDEQIFGYGW
jgi:hypothetical protein